MVKLFVTILVISFTYTLASPTPESHEEVKSGVYEGRGSADKLGGNGRVGPGRFARGYDGQGGGEIEPAGHRSGRGGPSPGGSDEGDRGGHRGHGYGSDHEYGSGHEYGRKYGHGRDY